MEGLLARKLGMTRVYGAEGEHMPVTVLEVGPCVVLQRKLKASDGYDAVQVGFVDAKESRLARPQVGHAKKAGAAPKRFVREFRADDPDAYKAGDVVTAAIFKDVPFVDVQGVCKGRGFQGVVRRHGMAGGPHTHGGHSKRRIGSIGCREFPGRVHKNKRMPGHMGNVTVTQQNLRVVAVRPDDNVVLVRGAVPGPVGGVLVVKRAVKKAASAS